MTTFTRDYNIIRVHYGILEELSKDHLQVPEIRRLIKLKEEELKNCKTEVQKIEPQETLDLLLETEKSYSLNTRLKEYKKKVSKYIDLYTELKQYSDPYIVQYNNEERMVLNLRLETIDNYLLIARNYCEINVKRIPIIEKHICQECGCPLSSSSCQECGTNAETGHIPKAMKSRVKIYNTILNFMKHIKHSMGLHVTKPFGDVMKAMDDVCINKTGKTRFMPSSEVIKFEVQKNGIRGPYNKTDFINLMSDAGYSKRNQDANIIISSYWGWTLYDYNELLVEFHRLATMIHLFYKDMNPDSSAINREYLLLKLSMHFPHQLGTAEFSLDQFKIIETPETIQNYEVDMKQIYDRFPKEDKDRYPFIPLKGSTNCRRIVLVEDQMEDGKSQYSAKFKQAYLLLFTKILTLVRGLVKSGHIEISDAQIQLIQGYVESKEELNAISDFASKFFGGGKEKVRNKINSINKQQIDYFKNNIKEGMPSDGMIRDIIEPTAERLGWLITEAKLSTKGPKGEELPVVSQAVMDPLWILAKSMLWSCIKHYEKEDIPGIENKEELFAIATEKDGFMDTYEREKAARDKLAAEKKKQK